MKKRGGYVDETATGRFRRIAEAQGLTSKVVEAARALKPPPSDDPAVRGWRYLVVAFTAANSIILAGHIVLACGLTPFFSGFAYASDQKSLVQEQKTARVEFIEARIFDLRVRQCEAINKGDNPQPYTIQLQQVWAKYRDVTGREPQVPSCRELGS